MGWAQSHLVSEILVDKVFWRGKNWTRDKPAALSHPRHENIFNFVFTVDNLLCHVRQKSPFRFVSVYVRPQQKPVSHQLPSFDSLSILRILNMGANREAHTQNGWW